MPSFMRACIQPQNMCLAFCQSTTCKAISAAAPRVLDTTQAPFTPPSVVANNATDVAEAGRGPVLELEQGGCRDGGGQHCYRLRIVQQFPTPCLPHSRQIHAQAARQQPAPLCCSPAAVSVLSTLPCRPNRVSSYYLFWYRIIHYAPPQHHSANTRHTPPLSSKVPLPYPAPTRPRSCLSSE